MFLEIKAFGIGSRRSSGNNRLIADRWAWWNGDFKIFHKCKMFEWLRFRLAGLKRRKRKGKERNGREEKRWDDKTGVVKRAEKKREETREEERTKHVARGPSIVARRRRRAVAHGKANRHQSSSSLSLSSSSSAMWETRDEALGGRRRVDAPAEAAT